MLEKIDQVRKGFVLRPSIFTPNVDLWAQTELEVGDVLAVHILHHLFLKHNMLVKRGKKLLSILRLQSCHLFVPDHAVERWKGAQIKPYFVTFPRGFHYFDF
jgi:hypothetical protein